MGIEKDKSQAIETDDMRRHAEEILRAKTTVNRHLWTEAESQRLYHELEVHQIELEMQNAELRQARDELETTLAKYTDLYDFAPVGYFTIDRDEIIRAANLTGANLLGIERARLLGRSFGLFVAAETRPLFSEFLGKMFATRVKTFCEVTLTKEGYPPLFLHIEAIACRSGQECRVVAVDITERKLAEDALTEKRRELEELNSSLEVRIAKASDELRQKDQILVLQDRMAIMGEMINNIAHQWRQPLNALGLVIQHLPLIYESGELSEKILEDNIGKSMKLIMHMSQTIDDFRNFFRSDKAMVPFHINHVIRQTVSLIEDSFKAQQVSIAYHPEGDPLAKGYPNEYSQVLLNILMNARDELVRHKVDDAMISIRAFTERDTTVVTISDNAGGIAVKIMDKIFHPYFTTKGPDKGTGIGLFMSKTIIEKNMGGRLTARNNRNGAEFRIEV
jgi:hypothetical protein